MWLVFEDQANRNLRAPQISTVLLGGAERGRLVECSHEEDLMATPGNCRDTRTKQFLAVPHGVGRVRGHKLQLGSSPRASPHQHLHQPPSCFQLPRTQLLKIGGRGPQSNQPSHCTPPSQVPAPRGQQQRQGAGSGAVWVRAGGRKPVGSRVSDQRVASVPNPSLSARSFALP